MAKAERIAKRDSTNVRLKAAWERKQESNYMRKQETKLRTVGALREALAKFPQDAVPMIMEPPFTGVKLIRQTKSGSVLIAPCDENKSKTA